jgi:hypothetical protein
MKEVPLTQGLVAIVDDEDYELVSRYTWQAVSNGADYYAVCTIYEDDGTQWPLRMHRLIMNAPDDMEVDHVNNNTLDYQRSNMRLATRSQNNANRTMPQGEGGSGYRGVYRTTSGRWRAQIKSGGTIHQLGSYDTPEEAARAWDEAALQMHGSFARLNFPENMQEE